jgi:formate hydrogenlyase subunit 5
MPAGADPDEHAIPRRVTSPGVFAIPRAWTNRPYDAYKALGMLPAMRHEQGDALARLQVRWAEITESFHLLRPVADELADRGAGERPGSRPRRP